MSEIKWDDAWTLGNELVDNQHKRLIGILNKVSNGNFNNSHEVLGELIAYAAEHFADEEQFMIKHKLPQFELDYHIQEHRRFTNALLDISFDMLMYENNPEELNKSIGTLRDFGLNWFKHHFLVTDKKVIDFINHQGGDI